MKTLVSKPNSGDGGNRTHVEFPPNRSDVVLVPCKLRRLPVWDVRWLEDTPTSLVDVCGRRRSSATMPEFRKGKKPGNAGLKYPAQPLTDAEVLALMDACPNNPAYRRLRALIALLWRSGLRISEALDLLPHDLDRDEGTVYVRCGKGSKQRVSAMDDWGFAQVAPWLEERRNYPAGPLFCIVEGKTKGGRMSSPWVRTALAKLAVETGCPKRVHPHGFRHSHACSLAREGQPIHVTSRQLGHTNVATTATYLMGIEPSEVIKAVRARQAPTLESLERPS